MLYGTCYYPEQREATRWAEDLRLMAKAGMNAMRVGEFAWKRFEPVPGSYDFRWLDAFLELASVYSIGLVLCPPLRTIPAWLAEQDPALMIETKEGHRLAYASRYTFCINHPLLREKSHQLASALAARYGSDPRVIGWHLDNEIGDEPDCHCAICTSKWQQWLEHRYGEVDQLNRAWGTVFWGMEVDHFGQIPTPRITKADYNPSFVQSWRQFRSDCNVDITRLLSEAIRPFLSSGSQYVTTNNQMLWNNRTDYFEMARHLDITGTNYYPPYGDNSRALAFGLAVNRGCKKAPFHVYELRNGGHAIPGASNNTPAPGELERLTMHTIANGADGVFYFPWKQFPFGCEQNHGALTDYDGKPTRLYDECSSIGERLQQLSPVIGGSQVVSDIAILYDYPCRWHVEEPSGWMGDNQLYVQTCNTLYQTVRKLGFNCDAVGRSGDFSAYKLLLVPMLAIVDDELVAKLQQYASAGGVIVFHPMSGIKNADAVYYPERLHLGMIQLIGSTTAETATSGSENSVKFRWRERTYACGMFHELIVPTSAQTAGEFVDQWFEGSAAVTSHTVDEGRVWFIATFAEEKFYKDLISFLCQEIGISPLLGAVPPDAVEVSMRQSADGTKYIFILNGSGAETAITLPHAMTDIWNKEPVEGTLCLKPYQVRIITDLRTI
ncbi:beta-galactosidase [Paenibacillus oryzisoli]|uniref:beta-galactosidase n=1 Tax=Paenibacillus oryzisoli TaxID=1850517 RepID=UPI003D265C80